MPTPESVMSHPSMGLSGHPPLEVCGCWSCGAVSCAQGGGADGGGADTGDAIRPATDNQPTHKRHTNEPTHKHTNTQTNEQTNEQVGVSRATAAWPCLRCIGCIPCADAWSGCAGAPLRRNVGVSFWSSRVSERPLYPRASACSINNLALAKL